MSGSIRSMHYQWKNCFVDGAHLILKLIWVMTCSLKRKFKNRFCKSDPVMVLGNFGLKPVVNCQLTLAVDHFFPKINNFQKIVNLVLELGLGSSSRPSISSRTRSGFQFLF
jgi:hypothetical protein